MVPLDDKNTDFLTCFDHFYIRSKFNGQTPQNVKVYRK